MMGGEASVAVDGERDESQWIIAAATPGQAVRFAAPQSAGAPAGVWVEVRALTHREVLERESLGTYEECEVSPDGRVLLVTRRYDLWAMAEYDYTRSLVGFCLPQRGADGGVTLRQMRDGSYDENLALLEAMPRGLAEWVQECIDRVNLRVGEGHDGLMEAQKKCGS